MTTSEPSFPSTFPATISSTSETPAIKAAIQKYFDGFLGQDTSALRAAFHPDAKLIAVSDGAVSGMLTSDWFSRIDARRQAGTIPTPGEAIVISIDQTDNAAVGKVRITFPTHTFVDYLSLLKAENGWQIVNKIYAVLE